MPIRGWGEDPKKIEAIIKDDPEALAAFNNAMKLKPGTRMDLANNVSEVGARNTEHGNRRAYSIERVQKECDEETIEAVMSGEMSPNAALIKAGVRENRQIYVPRDAAKAAAKLRERFGEAFADELRDLL
jgi:preprotein translocase subunit SecF